VNIGVYVAGPNGSTRTTGALKFNGLARQFDFIDKRYKFSLLWVYRFPLLNDEESTIDYQCNCGSCPARHFTKEEDMDKARFWNPAFSKSRALILVLNGSEIGGWF